MEISQRTQNPDVNSYSPDAQPGETSNSNNTSDDIEREKGKDIPVPPDSPPPSPVEEPPKTEGAPVGDIDDSPKRIA